MKSPLRFSPLVLSALRRHRLRTWLTILSVLIAFLLFGLLQAIDHAFYGGVKAAGRRILVTMSAESMVEPLPRAYAAEITTMKDVHHVAYEVWMGGYYQHHNQLLYALAVSPRRWLAEEGRALILPHREISAWLKDRSGALVGNSVARTYGWKPGEIVPMRSDIWIHPDGRNTWPVRIDGIFHSTKKALSEGFLVHYRYWNTGMGNPNQVSLLRVKVTHLRDLGKVARAIDARFANSPHPTRTASAQTFVKHFINQTVDIGVIVEDILAAVFFTMLLVTANTLTRSVRERSGEIAVLHTQGYSRPLIFALILAEALILVLTGALAGTGLAVLIVQGLRSTLEAYLPYLTLTPRTILLTLGLSLLFAVLSSLLPLLQVQRLRTVDALRRG
jgi:putative ABC transport system permease protein